jgi:hypothetical protein
VQARRSRQPDPYGADALTVYQVESDAALPTVDNTQTTRFAISQTKAVFRPCNPMEAKQDIALEGACKMPTPLQHGKPLSPLGLGIFRGTACIPAERSRPGYRLNTNSMRLLGDRIGPMN